MQDEMSLQEFVEEQDFANAISATNKAVYCSMKADSVNEKKILYRAMSSPDKKISDCQNLKIRVKDFFCETVECKDDSGAFKQCPRIVLIDDKGVSYQSVSFGIYNSVRRLVTVFGLPTWDTPITVIPKQVNSGKNKINILEIE